MALIAIGPFSRMTRLSVKALRLYDDNGLLRPAHVDPATGYRYYAPGQVDRAEAIRILRSVEMPLDEIRAVLADEDPAIVMSHLLHHKARLAERLAAQERMLSYLELIIQRKEIVMPYPVVIEEVAASLVAGHRFNTSLARIAGDIQRGFGTLMQGLGKARLAPSGAPLIVYHEVIDQETTGDVELCVPVGSALNGDGAVQTRMLEGGTVATTTHRGPYDQIGPAYHAVSTWIANNGYAVAGPPREIYLNDPMREKPEDLLTRIEYPVTRTAD